MSIYEEQFTPIDKRITLYNKYNNTSLDVNNLLCNKCNTWLTKPMYLMKNGYNVCEQCMPPNDCIQNISLEKLLEGKKYPCRFHIFGCTGFFDLILSHEEQCDLIKRCICGNVFFAQNDLIEHLKKEHAMKTLKLTKPVAEWQMDTNEGDFWMLLEAGKIQLIVYMMPGEIPSKLKVCVYDGSNTQRIQYAIKTIHGNISHMVHGVVTNSLWKGNDITTIQIPTDNETDSPMVKVKIYFDNYENFEAIETVFNSVLKNQECPVCMNAITEYCHQCIHGHNLCTQCKPKVTQCPICRLEIAPFKINIKHLTSHIQRLCKYSTNGCFAHGSLAEIQNHEMTCPMKLVTCDLCNYHTFDETIFFDHMLRQHNLQILKDSQLTVVPGYIAWTDCVFKFDFIISDHNVMRYDERKQRVFGSTAHNMFPLKVSQQKISWFVQLIHGPQPCYLYNYKLIIEICGRYIETHGKVRNDEKRETLFYTTVKAGAPPTLKLCFAINE